MPSHEIDHGGVVEVRYVYLTPVNQPNVVVLERDADAGVVEHEQAYFLRRYPDGRLCDGHTHDSIDEARSCSSRTALDPLWSDLARVVAEVSMRRS